MVANRSLHVLAGVGPSASFPPRLSPHREDLRVGGGIKRNRVALPKGRSNLFGGNEPQPGDQQIGGWSRERLERMDDRFVSAVERALRSGQEKRKAAGATVEPGHRK